MGNFNSDTITRKPNDLPYYLGNLTKAPYSNLVMTLHNPYVEGKLPYFRSIPKLAATQACPLGARVSWRNPCFRDWEVWKFQVKGCLACALPYYSPSNLYPWRRALCYVGSLHILPPKLWSSSMGIWEEGAARRHNCLGLGLFGCWKLINDRDCAQLRGVGFFDW